MKVIKANILKVEGGCGILNVFGYAFSIGEILYHEKYIEKFDFKSRHSSSNYCHANWTLLCFVNTPVCEEVYKLMTSRYNIAFQSPVRRNDGSGNDFFFIILDVSKEKTK